MSERLAYLASPYSHPDPAMRISNFEEVSRTADRLLKNGHLVLSPITHSHPIAMAGDHSNVSHTAWCRINEEFIRRCDEVWVVKMDGWMLSAGIQAEVAFAESIGKPVRCIEP